MHGNKNFSFKLVQIVVLTFNLLIHCPVGNDVEALMPAALVSKDYSNASLCIESIECVFLMSPSHAREMTLTFEHPFCNFLNEIEKKVFQDNVKGIMEEIGDPTLQVYRFPSKKGSRDRNEELVYVYPLNEEEFNALLRDRFMKIKERLTTDGFISAAVNDIEPRGSRTEFVESSIIFSYHPFNWSLRGTTGAPLFLRTPSPLLQLNLLQSSELEEKNNLKLCRDIFLVKKVLSFFNEMRPSLRGSMKLEFKEPLNLCFSNHENILNKIKDVLKRSEDLIFGTLTVKPLNPKYLIKILQRTFLAIKETMKSSGLLKAAIDDIKFRVGSVYVFLSIVEAYSNDPFEWSLTFICNKGTEFCNSIETI